MSTQQQQRIEHTFLDDICQLCLLLDKPGGVGQHLTDLEQAGSGKLVENVRNCDVFVEDFHFLFYVDVRLFKFHSPRQLDVKDMKQLIIRYSSTHRSYHIDLPCLPMSVDELEADRVQPEKGELEKKSEGRNVEEARTLDLWKLNRITENCMLQLDDHAELVQFVANFDYGFAGKFKGKIDSGESNLDQITRMPEPYLSSPLQRRIDREIDELKNFSRDQYKLNFVELQVPEGHENPMKFHINFNVSTLTRDEECLLHNITCKAAEAHLPNVYNMSEIDCGLISILLAICYDVRSTGNDPTCESGWTRSILSATLTYFEPFECLKDVVINFLRRSLIYPLYRNYDFGRHCVQDAIDALQKNSAWIVKQLLITHELFLSSDFTREAFNRYFIEDYVRYVADGDPCTSAHLQTLARNLKNVLLDVSRKHLQLDLFDIEKELLKELVEDIHLNETAAGDTSPDDYDEDDDEDGDDDDGTESGEDESSSASDTEENSVIEQRMDALNI